jgi:ABC-type transporter Mla MlaB component
VLRISIEQHASSLSLVIEGRLVGPWVEELRRVIRERAANAAALSIDLCGVTAMDAAGHALLEELHQGGATLSCSDVLNQYLVEQMARPAGDVQAACLPCRRISSHNDLPVTAEDLFESSKAS